MQITRNPKLVRNKNTQIVEVTKTHQFSICSPPRVVRSIVGLMLGTCPHYQATAPATDPRMRELYHTKLSSNPSDPPPACSDMLTTCLCGLKPSDLLHVIAVIAALSSVYRDLGCVSKVNLVCGILLFVNN